MSFASVHDVVALAARRGENGLYRLDGRAGQGEVVAHLVHVSTGAAKVRLHVDDEHDGVFGAKIAVVRPRIRICLNEALHCYSCTGPESPKTKNAQNTAKRCPGRQCPTGKFRCRSSRRTDKVMRGLFVRQRGHYRSAIAAVSTSFQWDRFEMGNFAKTSPSGRNASGTLCATGCLVSTIQDSGVS